MLGTTTTRTQAPAPSSTPTSLRGTRLGAPLAPSVTGKQAVSYGDGNVNVAGAVQVGRDLHIKHETNVQSSGPYVAPGGAYIDRFLSISELTIGAQPSDLVTPVLDKYGPDSYPMAKELGAYLRELQQHHLLVLQGELAEDCAELVRAVAWHFQRVCEHELAVLEWECNQEGQRFLSQLHKRAEPTIYLLPRLMVKHLGPQGLEKLRGLRRHYFIISTDAEPQSWELADKGLPAFWHRVNEREVFSAGELARALGRLLREQHDRLPPELLARLGAGAPLDGEITAAAAAARLQTLFAVETLVRELVGRKELPTGAVATLVAGICESGSSVEAGVRRWYLESLDARERQLALQAALFCELRDEVFFAVLEHLRERVWRDRYPDSRAYDYDDLVALAPRIQLNATRDRGCIVEARGGRLRYWLLRAAWDAHRRQVVAIMRELPALVRECVTGSKLGGEDERQRFLDVVAEAISDVGLLDSHLAEQVLVELAVDADPQVQNVAAMAVARWRGFGKDAEFFAVLESWQRERRVREAVARLVGEESGGLARAYSCLRSTVALAIGEGAKFDPPHHMDPALVRLFEELSRDPDKQVRVRFQQQTLQMVIARHGSQIEELLYELVGECESEDRMEVAGAVAEGLARAYGDVADDVLTVIGSWLRRLAALASGPDERRQRSAVMAAIALTYGLIDYERYPKPLNMDGALGYLRKILREERAVFVRKATAYALLLQARRALVRVEGMLRDALASLNKEETETVVAALVDLCAQQRAQLPGSDGQIFLFDRPQGVWMLPRTRPWTEVEWVLLQWVMDENHPEAQAVSLRAMTRFAEEIEFPVGEAMLSLVPVRQRDEQEAARVAAGPEDLWLARRLPWMIEPDNSERRARLRGVLATAMQEVGREGPALAQAFKALLATRDREIRTMVWQLNRAMQIAGRSGKEFLWLWFCASWMLEKGWQLARRGGAWVGARAARAARQVRWFIVDGRLERAARRALQAAWRAPGVAWRALRSGAVKRGGKELLRRWGVRFREAARARRLWTALAPKTMAARWRKRRAIGRARADGSAQRRSER